MLMAVCLVGCTKPDDDNNGGNNGGGNNGGTEVTDYHALIHDSGWDGVAPANSNLFVEFLFDYDDWTCEYSEGKIIFLYGKDGDGGAVLVAKGTYSVSGNVFTANYTDIEIIEHDATWTYGHTYGLTPGQSKTLNYTIQSCTESTMQVKESVMGDTWNLTKY